MDRGWRRGVKRGGWIATGLGSVWFITVQILDIPREALNGTQI